MELEQRRVRSSDVALHDCVVLVTNNKILNILLAGSSNVGFGQGGFMPSTYWITNPKNSFIGNIAGGSIAFGFWFDMSGVKAAVYTFKDNVAHGCERDGISLYPNGYQPSTVAYFDNLKLYNNKVGMKFKRTRNIRLVNSFFAFNGLGIEYFKNNVYMSIKNTTFHAVPPGHADTMCATYEEGIEFSYETSGRQLRIQDSSFVGYNNPRCKSVGLALKLANLQGTAVSNGVLPRLSNLIFDPPGKNSSFGISPNSAFNDLEIILEDKDGSMSGEQGFFINNNPIGPLAMSQCSSTGGRRPDTLFCSGCLQYVVIEARELGPSKLVITSRSDPAKTLQLEGSGVQLSDPAFNTKFTLGFVSFDEYDASFFDVETGEQVYISSSVIVGEAQSYCAEGVEMLTEESFIFPQIEMDNVHLYKRINATGEY